MNPISDRAGTAVTLDMLKLAVTRRVSQHLGSFVAGSLTLEASIAEELSRSLVVELRGYLLAHKRDVYTEIAAPLTLEVVVPATAWHHFRHMHAGAWWLRWLRTPIRYTTHRRTGQMTASLTRYLTFPLADVPYPADLRTPVTVWQPDRQISWRDFVEPGPSTTDGEG